MSMEKIAQSLFHPHGRSGEGFSCCERAARGRHELELKRSRPPLAVSLVFLGIRTSARRCDSGAAALREQGDGPMGARQRAIERGRSPLFGSDKLTYALELSDEDVNDLLVAIQDEAPTVNRG